MKWPGFLCLPPNFSWPNVQPVPRSFTSPIFSPYVDGMLETKDLPPGGCQAVGFWGAGL